MAENAPESSVGWLDHSAKDSQRMRELISAFRDRQSIDNLGIGIVRDSISEQLFPGISTIQTRARYFFFVPWLCQRLEGERVSSADFSRRYRALETALIDRLVKTGEVNGVIGYQARDGLKRLAIEVYWGGLGAYGIRRVAGSVSEYRRGLGSLYRHRSADNRDDDGNAVGPVLATWDTVLPVPPQDFYEHVDLALTEDEAAYLVNSIRRSQPGTLVASLAGRDSSLFDEPDIWHLPDNAFPEGQRDLIRHAQLFAVAAQPARALYNLLLARRRSDHPLAPSVEAKAEEELEQWRSDRLPLLPALDDWVAKLDDFWKLADPDHSIPSPRKGSIARLVGMCHAHAEDLEQTAALHREIEETERKLKGPLARLTPGRARDTWTGQAFGTGYLDYRWRPAMRILGDIGKALA